jgi:hypothetical protein
MLVPLPLIRTTSKPQFRRSSYRACNRGRHLKAGGCRSFTKEEVGTAKGPLVLKLG